MKNIKIVLSCAGLDAGLESGVRLGNFKQKHMKFLNCHQNPHKNEIILAKREVRKTPLNPSGSTPGVVRSVFQCTFQTAVEILRYK